MTFQSSMSSLLSLSSDPKDSKLKVAPSRLSGSWGEGRRCGRSWRLAVASVQF